MKKKPNDADIAGLMAKIQAQLAVLDRKLDSFMTKSLTELAEAKAAQAQKPAQVVMQRSAPIQPHQNIQHPGRQMYDVVCFDCGKDTQIPFKPSGDRPVYCKECFAKRRAGNAPKVSGPVSSAPSFSPPAASVEVRSSTPKAKPAKAKKVSTKKKVIAKKKSKKK